MKTIVISKLNGKTAKERLEQVLLPRHESIEILSQSCKNNVDSTILNPGDMIHFNQCKWYKPTTVKGSWIWTGMRFIKI